MGILRRMLGVAQGTYRWAVLSELQVMPYHFYWIRALLKFHKQSVIESNSDLLRAVVQADAELAADSYWQREPSGAKRLRKCDRCWSAELANGLASIGQAAGLDQAGSDWAKCIIQRQATY